MGEEEGTLGTEGTEGTEEPGIFEAAGVTDPPPPEGQESTGDPPVAEDRPDWLPEKFSSPQELVEAYNSLGTKIREVQQSHAPENYELNLPEELKDVEVKAEDTEIFRSLGLTNDQAQGVMDYLVANIVPEIQNARMDVEFERLAEGWNTTKESKVFIDKIQKIHDWGKKNLPAELVKELGKTASGVATVERMMDSYTYL